MGEISEISRERKEQSKIYPEMFMPILIRSGRLTIGRRLPTGPTAAAVVFLAFAAAAPANDLSGTWRAWFVGPIGDQPKTVSEMTFDIKVDGDQVTGTAHMSSWPGDARISDGRVEGNRLSFTAIGHLPWRSRSPEGESSGYPKLDFDVKVNGQEAELKVTWGNVMIYGNSPHERTLEMRGEKVSDSK